jgi:hypothetical protein
MNNINCLCFKLIFNRARGISREARALDEERDGSFFPPIFHFRLTTRGREKNYRYLISTSERTPLNPAIWPTKITPASASGAQADKAIADTVAAFEVEYSAADTMR